MKHEVRSDDIAAISMIKNEQDIIYRCLLNLYTIGIKKFVIADNLSTDNTRSEMNRFSRTFQDQ